MFIGMTLGGWLWGSLADRFGRKYPLMIALAMNAAFGLFSALAVNYPMFLVFRVLSGIGLAQGKPSGINYGNRVVCQALRVRKITCESRVTCQVDGQARSDMEVGLHVMLVDETGDQSGMAISQDRV